MTILVLPVPWGQKILESISTTRSRVSVGICAPDELIQDTELDQEHDRVVEHFKNIGVLDQGQHSRANCGLGNSLAGS